jgi:formylglycine-generating enzyme required for sulfatase activity
MVRLAGLLLALLLLLLLTLTLLPLSALAEKRVALVIGNGLYTKVDKLPNPPHDAEAMAVLLRKAGFEVIAKTDLSGDVMRSTLRDFSDQVRDADMALVFYAGHGMEMNGVNYLIPVDARIARDIDVEDEAISLDRIIRTIEPARRLQLVILDACRDNPFVRSMRRTIVSRSLRSGHGDIDERGLPANMLIAYAQKAGSTADDGDGANSPYTAALLNHLATPGLDVELALRRARDEVLKTTRNRQEPFKYGSLSGSELALVPAAGHAEPASPPTQARLSEAAEAWDRTKDTTSIALLETFIVRYKDTYYADLARARIEDIKKRQVAIATPPAPPPARPDRCDGAEAQVGDEKRCLKPKDTFRDCPGCPEMVVVPAGYFTMGSPPNEEGRFDGEGPQHGVTIGKPFAVGRFAVTRGEFETFIREAKHAIGDKCWTFDEHGKYEERTGLSFRNPGFAQGDRNPVVCVNWNDAKVFTAWLSTKTGRAYSLLTEAEREYVTRAGSTTRYSFGNNEKILCRFGNVADQTAKRTIKGAEGWTIADCTDGYAYTAPVGQFAPNAFGIHDVHGNVWDWTEDCWNDNYQGAPTDGSVWRSGNCSYRVVRGGSFGLAPLASRSAFRGRRLADYQNVSLGFRVARTLHP